MNKLNSCKPFALSVILIILVTTVGAQPRALISLTYDDGMETQLQNAIPQLNEYNLKGTFYLNTTKGRSDAKKWKEAAQAGHELGNHTLHHACPETMGWEKPFATEYYDLKTLMDEVRATDAILQTLDPGAEMRTFAYPCNNFKVGGQSYIMELSGSGLVQYARGGGNFKSVITDRASLNPYHAPSWPVPEDCTLETIISFLESVYSKNGFGVLQFHGVGGQWIKISNETHEGLVAYLDKNRDRFEVLPFGLAMKKYLEK